MSEALDLDEQEGALSPDEAAHLFRLEETIERGLSTFVEVGCALLAIRDKQLHRETHETFEDYCQERWGFKRAQAYRLMGAAEVAIAVSPIGDIPANEAQARELAPLLREQGPDAVQEAWAEVVEEHEKPTAEVVREVVKRKRPRAKPAEPPPVAAETEEPAEPAWTLPALLDDYSADEDLYTLLNWLEAGEPELAPWDSVERIHAYLSALLERRPVEAA